MAGLRQTEYMDTDEPYENNYKVLTSPHKNVLLLNLTQKYAESWGTWEGVRELIQNWHDGIYDASEQAAKQEFFASLTKVEFKVLIEEGDEVIYQAVVSSKSKPPEVFGYLQYNALQQRLNLINHRTALEKKILLLGYSSHSRHKDVIGQFGEGLKIGALALVRKNVQVTMETNREGWQFVLHPYEHFENEKGLAVFVTKPEELPFNQQNQMTSEQFKLDEGDTLVSIYPLHPEKFKICRNRFLFLNPPSDSVQTEIGTLLLDDRFSGQLFVKGSWVSDLSDDNLNTGVDFCELKIDRDRNAVPQLSEIDHKVSCMWPRALEQRRDLAHRYYNLLANNPNCRDVKHASTYAVTETTAALMAEQFRVNNPDAFPVMDSFAWQEMQNLQDELQRKVVSCNQALLGLLHKSGRYSTLEEARAAMKAKKSDVKPFSTLSAIERSIIEHAVKLANLIDPKLKISMIDIIDTPDEEKPTFQGERIEIPMWMLDEETTHKSGLLCTPATGKCMCREIRICNALLNLRRDFIESKPTKHAREPQLEQIFMKILSRSLIKECERAPKHIVPGKVNQSAIHASCKETQESLSREIERMKTEQKQSEKMHVEERARLQHECEIVKNELENNMKMEDSESRVEDLRQQYQKEMQRIEQRFNHELKEKDELAKRLGSEAQTKHEEVKKTMEKIQAEEDKLTQYSKELDHRHTVLVERVVEFRKKLTAKANEVKHAKTSETKDKKFTKGLCEEVANTCNSICTELEGQAYICVVCKTNRRAFASYPCCHYVYCETCAQTIFKGDKRCAHCRTEIERIFKVNEF